MVIVLRLGLGGAGKAGPVKLGSRSAAGHFTGDAYGDSDREAREANDSGAFRCEGPKRNRAAFLHFAA